MEGIQKGNLFDGGTVGLATLESHHTHNIRHGKFIIL
jgi:hypothetical protein